MDDFYEDDEPFEKIEEAFERGEKVRTVRPRGQTIYLDEFGSHLGLNTWTT